MADAPIRPGADSRVKYVPIVHKVLVAAKVMLERNWAIWLIIVVIGLLWFISEKTGIVYTPAEDGVLGGFIAIILSEGIRAAIRSVGSKRRETHAKD